MSGGDVVRVALMVVDVVVVAKVIVLTLLGRLMRMVHHAGRQIAQFVWQQFSLLLLQTGAGRLEGLTLAGFGIQSAAVRQSFNAVCLLHKSGHTTRSFCAVHQNAQRTLGVLLLIL